MALARRDYHDSGREQAAPRAKNCNAIIMLINWYLVCKLMELLLGVERAISHWFRTLRRSIKISRHRAFEKF